MHQIKRTTNFATTMVKKTWNTSGMRSAIPSLLAVLWEGAVWESLRRGRQGKLTEWPYYFIPVDFFWVKCVRYSSCHDWEFWNSKCPSDFEDFWQFSEEFWTLPKMSEDVPANFQSFQSYLKVTILAFFDLIMVCKVIIQCLHSLQVFYFFRGCR